MADFRQKLSARGLTWAVGIGSTQTVHPADVAIAPAPARATGRPPKRPVPAVRSRSAQSIMADLPDESWRTLSWRRGANGDLAADFAALRVRVADGPMIARNRRLPGAAAWLVCERRVGGERKYHLSNAPEDASLKTLALLIKSRWVCEQMHQQMKGKLGFHHFRGRSWQGLHHHALMTMIAFAFLPHLRLGGKTTTSPGPPPCPSLPQVRRQLVATLRTFTQLRPHCRQPVPYHLQP